MHTLHRIDPRVNMARFYAVSLQRSLFGDIVLVRRWGRIGIRGQVKSDWYDAPDAAEQALGRLLRTKTRRGYQMITQPLWPPVAQS